MLTARRNFAAPTPPPDSGRTRRRPRAWLAAGTAAATIMASMTLVLFQAPDALALTSATTAYQAPNTPAPSVAGATTPFATYQAPQGALGGGASVVSLTSAPTSQYDSAQGEAAGHAYVQLTGNGQSVQWTNQTGQPINFVNVRATIPDTSNGGGTTATLDLYVNGVFRQALNMNSIQSWEYEGNNNYQGSDENAADGDPRDFWDEFHATITGAPIPAGATFSLQKDTSNSASFYWINSIDLWNAPAPAAQPANSISITSCGAVADNTPTNGTAAPGATDSTADIQNCINQAASAGKILWIPQGTFYLVGTNSLTATNVTIEGAGYWYSEIYRDVPLPNNVPLGAIFQCYSCHLQSFHIDSDAMSRTEVDGGGGAEDTTGTNWSIENMWVQHVESSVWASGSGGLVENNFFTVIFADGCNLNNVSLTGTSGSNLTATNNFIRGTGDDGMAINSVAYNTNGSTTTNYTAMTNITMTHNTVIGAWGGKGIGVYGGSGQVVDNNYIADTSRFIGLGVGRFGVNGSDMTGAAVSGNVIVRSGGNAYVQGQPALQIGNGGDGQNVGVVSNATVTDNTIIQSMYDGIGFSTSTATNLSDNTVINPWRNGIVISPPFYPAPSGNATITANSVIGLSSGYTAFANDSGGFTTSVSNNSWQNSTGEGPYGGTAAAVPGTVQAANYDTGGQAVGYNVNSVNGTGNSYRSDGVDLEATSDTGGGYDLGWTAQGQWTRYTVNAAAAGSYTVSFRVSATNAVANAFHLTDTAGNDLTGEESIAATGGAQNWSTITDTVALAAGKQTLVLNQDNSGWNIHYLSFVAGSGTTPAATLTASQTSLSFGSHAVNTTSAAQSVTVSNIGTAAASISSIAVGTGFSQTNTCGTSLAVGASCTVQVTFTPSAAQSYNSTLTIASNASNGTLAVPLSGTGVGSTTNLALGATITASTTASGYPPSNVNDGNTSSYWESSDGAAYPQTLTANLGNTQSLGSVTLDLPPATAWATRTETLAVLGSTNGSSWTTLVSSAGYTFNPATGNTVSINLPSGTSDQYLQLSFTANTGWTAAQISEFQIFPGSGGGGGPTPTATLTASPTSQAFGNQAVNTTSAARAVTVSNTGTAAASISSIAAGSPFAETNTCGSSLAAGGSCTVSVTFTPTVAQSYSSNLTVSSNATNGTLAVALSGTGTGGSSTPTNLALNKTATASSYTQTYTASNAVDGNANTYWEGTNGAWPTTLSVNLGASHSISSVVIDLPPATAWSTRTQTLSVLDSSNGSTWTTLVGSATYTFNPATGNTVTISLPAGTTTQYVELSFTANNVQNGAQASEFQVMGI